MATTKPKFTNKDQQALYDAILAGAKVGCKHVDAVGKRLDEHHAEDQKAHNFLYKAQAHFAAKNVLAVNKARERVEKKVDDAKDDVIARIDRLEDAIPQPAPSRSVAIWAIVGALVGIGLMIILMVTGFWPTLAEAGWLAKTVLGFIFMVAGAMAGGGLADWLLSRNE